MLELGAAEVGTALPPDLGYWRDFAARVVTAICTHPDLDTHQAPIPAPAPTELDALAAAAPPMTGTEYVTASVLDALWTATAAAFRSELAESKASAQTFLQRKSPAWHLVGRVHFNLAENRRDDEAPFAFLATYTTQLSTAAKAQHLPLGRALSEYAGAANKPRLLSLLLPVERAAAECPWLNTMIEAGEIYHPLRWTPARSVSTADGRPPPRGRRRRRAGTDRMAGQIVHPVHRSRPPSGASRRLVSGRTRCSTSRWASASTANR